MSRLRSWPGHAPLALAARLYLGGLFLLASWHKILHPDLFALDVATYQVLPLAGVNLFALVLPWVELGAGALLVLGVRVRAGAMLVAGMMAAFIAALSLALAKGLALSCGCFASQTATEDPISGWTLVRDAAWLLLALYVLVFDERPWGLGRLARRWRTRSAARPAPGT